MTSNDNGSDMNNIALQLRELITINREQIAEMKALAAQMQKDNAEFRERIKDDINSRFNTFENRFSPRFDKLEATIGVMQNDITGLKHDVAGLYHWDYWLLTIIVAILALPQIISGVKALFSAITEGIAGIIAIFRKESISHDK